MNKIVYISNIPSPYQIKWATYLEKYLNIEFWFVTSIEKSMTGRPDYWNIKMPKNCKFLPSKIHYHEFCYVPTLKNELERYNPDIIMLGGGWYMYSWFRAYFWGVKNKKKIMAGPLEFNESMYLWCRILRNKIIYKCLYNKIDMYLANGYIHYDYLKVILKTKNNIIFMNYDDYSPYLEHPIRNENSIITFMYGGNISRRLRVPEIIKTFEKLAKNYQNVRLVIGGYGPEKEICKKAVENSFTLKEKVFFYDVKTWNEVSEVYKQCDVIINFASYSPGSGVILSAVASGMGVISMESVHASRHFIIDNYNGFIIYDERSLYLAMEKFIINKYLLKLHSERNKNIGKSTLTFDYHLQQFKIILERLSTI